MIALFASNEFIFKFSHFQRLDDKLFNLIFLRHMKTCLYERKQTILTIIQICQTEVHLIQDQRPKYFLTT